MNEPPHDGLPPLRLEPDRSPEPADVAHAPRWHRVAAAVGLVVATAVTSVIVVDSRNDAAADEVAAAEISLVPGIVMDDVRVEDDEPFLVSSVSLHNAGPRAIEVSEVRMPGREVVLDVFDDGPWTIAPDGWQTVRTAYALNCDEGSVVPDYIDVVASSEARDETVRLALPPDGMRGMLTTMRTWCSAGGAPPLVVNVTDVNVDGATSNALRMIVMLGSSFDRPWPAPEPATAEVHVKAVSTTAAGLAVESDDLPAQVRAGSSAVFYVDWRVTDCERAMEFRDVRLALEWTSDGGGSPTVAGSRDFAIPTDAIFHLTRFVAGVCG